MLRLWRCRGHGLFRAEHGPAPRAVADPVYSFRVGGQPHGVDSTALRGHPGRRRAADQVHRRQLRRLGSGHCLGAAAPD